MKLRDMFKIKRKDKNLNFNYVTIGNVKYYIFEIKNSDLLYEKIITKLFMLEIPLYWFRSYYEFELFFSYFEETVNDVFILIY